MACCCLIECFVELTVSPFSPVLANNLQTSQTIRKKVLVVGAISQSLRTSKKQGKTDLKEAISFYEPQEI
jgi:hypothetical protein